jgi:hypothetical protein
MGFLRTADYILLFSPTMLPTDNINALRVKVEQHPFVYNQESGVSMDLVEQSKHQSYYIEVV